VGTCVIFWGFYIIFTIIFWWLSLARILGRFLTAALFLALVILVEMPLIFQSINTINLSSGFVEDGLQKILLIWLIDSFIIAFSFEWISLTLSTTPFVITLPLSLIYNTLNPTYGGIVLTNAAIVFVLIFARMSANII
jgi:hypothetical protein